MNHVRQYITKNKHYTKKTKNDVPNEHIQFNEVLGLLYAITMEFPYGLEQ